MCHGMGLTASAVGERIALVWSLSQLLRELDLTSLSGLLAAGCPALATCGRTANAAASPLHPLPRTQAQLLPLRSTACLSRSSEGSSQLRCPCGGCLCCGATRDYLWTAHGHSCLVIMAAVTPKSPLREVRSSSRRSWLRDQTSVMRSPTALAVRPIPWHIVALASPPVLPRLLP